MQSKLAVGSWQVKDSWQLALRPLPSALRSLSPPLVVCFVTSFPTFILL